MKANRLDRGQKHHWWDRVSEVLTQDRSATKLALIAGLIIFVFMSLVLGWGYISGYGDYWQNPNYDANTHVSGWLFYKADSWHLPIFDSRRMDYPQSASIVYTDSIPAVAVVAKLLNPIMPASWHYMGVFVLFCYAVNGLALLWLLKQLGFTNILSAAFAVVFAIFTSLFNLQFESMYAHFFIILSFGFYFKLLRDYRPRTMALFAGMVALSLMVHTYLFGPSLAIFIITLIMLGYHKKVQWRWLAAWLAGLVALVLVITLIGGYQDYKPWGYQEHIYGEAAAYALDVSATFNRHYSEDEIGTYVGLGAWLLLLGGLVALKWRPRLLKQHFLMVLFAVGLLLFAISNTVYWRGHQVAHLTLPAPLLNAAELFRASKRFLIILYYMAAVGGFVLVMRRWARAGVAIVIAALILQVASVSYYVQAAHKSAQVGPAPVLNQDLWGTKIVNGPYTYINVFPSYTCFFSLRGVPISVQSEAALELYHITAFEHKVSNQARVARRTKNCDQETKTAQQDPAQNSLNIYLADDNKKLIVEPSQKCLANAQPFAYGIYCTYNK